MEIGRSSKKEMMEFLERAWEDLIKNCIKFNRFKEIE